MKAISLKEPMDFPLLSQGSYGKVITKHFMNLHFTMHRDPLSLLCFLIYHSGIDNQVTYSTKLLNQYRATLKFAWDRWGYKKIGWSTPTNRRSFKILIEKGLLLKGPQEKQYLVNPILTYSKLYIKGTFWQSWIKGTKSPEDVQRYFDHARENYLKKKT